MGYYTLLIPEVQPMSLSNKEMYPSADVYSENSIFSNNPVELFLLSWTMPSMKAETLPTDGRSPSESTRMLWLSVSGVSAEATTNLLLVPVLALTTDIVNELPASTVLQNAGI